MVDFMSIPLRLFKYLLLNIISVDYELFVYLVFQRSTGDGQVLPLVEAMVSVALGMSVLYLVILPLLSS